MREPVNPAYRWYQWLWAGLDLLFPPICGGCGEKVGSRWCAQCQSQVRTVALPVCERCGQMISHQGLCGRCRKNPPPFSAIRSWALFDGGVRNAIHRLKYKQDICLGEVLARPLIALMTELNWQVELIIPVPLGIARLKERGYNQAALLAWPIALRYGLPYCSKALVRVRETNSQVSLSLAERQMNVKGAFRGITKWVGGKIILLVDDVATSCATMDACAQALLQAGASQVYGLTLARAVFKNSTDRSVT
jgi:competence protein ComFC